MFQDMGYTDEDELEAMSTSSAHWLIPALAEGRYRGWLAELPGGEIVAGGGLLIAPWLGLRVAVGVALAVVAGIAAVCWLLCTVGGPTRSPGEGRRDEP